MGQEGIWQKTGRTLPICLANLIVFFVVGVWHGAAWKYIVYGMYNGIIIAFSGLMAEHYRNWKKKFNITGKENWYHVFMIIRTFILVNISWFFDRADTVGQAFHMMKLSVTKFAPSQLLLIPAGKEGTAFICAGNPGSRLHHSVYCKCPSGTWHEDKRITCRTESANYCSNLFLSAGIHRILWINSSSERIYLCTILRKF